MKKMTLAAALIAAAFGLSYTASAFAETVKGTVTRLTVTIKTADGKRKMYEVRGDVNLTDVDEGDEVEVEVVKGEIQSIKVTKEDVDPPRK